MSNPSKKKGTAAETRVRKYFNDNGLECERKALAGSRDLGDLCLHLPNGGEVTVEVKAGKQTWNFSRGKLDEWKRQTLVEADNSKCAAILIIVRYRRNFIDAEVWWPNPGSIKEDGLTSDCWKMMYIDDFVKKVKESKE